MREWAALHFEGKSRLWTTRCTTCCSLKYFALPLPVEYTEPLSWPLAAGQADRATAHFPITGRPAGLIATTVDGDLPTGREWHRDLLKQMQVDLPDLHPPVLSAEAGEAIDEFLRFQL